MQPKMCSKCKKNIAVVFITKVENGVTMNEGYCLKCARSLGIPQIDQAVKQMGISDEDLDMLSDEMSSMFGQKDDSDSSDDDEIDSQTATFPLLNQLFGGSNTPAPQPRPSRKEEGEPKEKKKSKRHKFLDSYCMDLTGRAREGKLDKVIGRDVETERVIQILNRRQKNNPCLIGEPGVGKTAIAEGLAQRIAAGDVPYKLRDKEVFLLDLTALVAGTQFRGQFESRMKSLIGEIKECGNIILVIDEVHNLVGAGDAEGSMNAANILKPALSRGEIQVIGATTFAEYRKYIEKDAALERRFQPVTINEPSVEDSVAILKGVKKYYETYHGIKIADTLLPEVVRLSERYITDRYLPDKAIDLLDEAASYTALHSPIINELGEVTAEISDLTAKIEAVEAKEEKNEDDYKTIADYKTTLAQKRERFDALSAERDKIYLAPEALAKVIEVWTGIPASNITENEFSKIDRMEAELKKRIIGQDEAVERLVRAIKRSRAGIAYKKKPVSFIFAGTTGVGKTELVKVLANYMFDSPETLIRLDMSEYMEKHTVSRLVGSPPGYVGYDEAGQLTEKIRRKPYSVVLFDEIEKAHPDVLNILLQILDDGRITDSHGKVCNFENAIIVMTTNAGSTDSSSAGFNATGKTSDNARVIRALEGFLRPEFINRVDDIIVFNRLTKDDCAKIAMIMLGDLSKVLADKGIKLVYDITAAEAIAEKGYSDKYGARNLRRVIQTDIEDVIALKIIESYKNPVSEVTLSKDGDGRIAVSFA